jgi:hypothetical protein
MPAAGYATWTWQLKGDVSRGEVSGCEGETGTTRKSGKTCLSLLRQLGNIAVTSVGNLKSCSVVTACPRQNMAALENGDTRSVTTFPSLRFFPYVTRLPSSFLVWT